MNNLSFSMIGFLNEKERNRQLTTTTTTKKQQHHFYVTLIDFGRTCLKSFAICSMYPVLS